MPNIILIAILVLGTLLHCLFFSLNDVLKVADSFAYLSMSEFLRSFSQEGLGTGWFGFLYSLPIALIDTILWNELVSARIVNILLFILSALLLWKISRKYLSEIYSYGVIVLLFLSPILLHFNIHILSENIYIPLFLCLFLWTLLFIEESISIPSPSLVYPRQKKIVIWLACLIGLMYLTRAEAFIYIWSIGIIAIVMLIRKVLHFWQFLKLWLIFLSSFLLFISPYLWHLHSITGEWWLTNKWASNLRQAELRGREKMDDIGFERAVAELTSDKHHLIAGFAWGMPYDKPSIEWSLWAFIAKDPRSFWDRMWENQYKLVTKNIPEIFLGKAPQLFFSDDMRFWKAYWFFILCVTPFLILIYGIYQTYRKQKIFFYTSLAFFTPAFIFFTMFFTLNRYFLIFLPLMLIAFCFGLQSIWNMLQKWSRIIPFILYINIILIYGLSIKVYHSIESPKDEYYSLKKEAGEWLASNAEDTLKIMERFPIVTYYSGADYRYITPYTDDIWDIAEYARYNDLDILVVDSMDFLTYRPKLEKYLHKTPVWFTKIREFSHGKDQKVILYWVEK